MTDIEGYKIEEIKPLGLCSTCKKSMFGLNFPEFMSCQCKKSYDDFSKNKECVKDKNNNKKSAEEDLLDYYIGYYG